MLRKKNVRYAAEFPAQWLISVPYENLIKTIKLDLVNSAHGTVTSITHTWDIWLIDHVIYSLLRRMCSQYIHTNTQTNTQNTQNTRKKTKNHKKTYEFIVNVGIDILGKLPRARSMCPSGFIGYNAPNNCRTFPDRCRILWVMHQNTPEYVIAREKIFALYNICLSLSRWLSGLNHC